MKNIIYNSKYQNLHMDRANTKSMFTVEININSNLPYNPNAAPQDMQPQLVYEYVHGYGYAPQFWGLWDIKYADGNLGGITRRGYGYITHNTGFGLTATFYYTVDAVSVKLYFMFWAVFPGVTTSGTKAVFTGYLFANGRNNQDYTV